MSILVTRKRLDEHACKWICISIPHSKNIYDLLMTHEDWISQPSMKWRISEDLLPFHRPEPISLSKGYEELEKRSYELSSMLRIMFGLPKAKGDPDALSHLDGFLADLTGEEETDSSELVREARRRL